MKQEQNLSRWAEGSAYNAIQDIAIGFQKSQILFTAMKYDIFSQIHSGNNTAEKIAENINVDLKTLEKLLNALVSINLLTKNQFYYQNSEIYEKYLLKTSPNYCGFILHNADLWNSWGTLPEVIKTGKNVTNIPIYEKSNEFIEDFLLVFDFRTKLEKDTVIENLPLKKTKKFLKFGAISCRYAFEIANLHPEIEVFIVDFPNVIEVSEKIAAKEFDCKNLKFIKCDYLKDDYGNNYDTVLMDSIIEEYSVAENINTLKKVYNSIANGGQLIIHQLLTNDARTGPRSAVFQSLNLLLNTASGDSYTYSDIWVVLKEAGFQNVESYKTEAQTNIIIASKSIIG